jgi:nitrosocyanin
MTRSSDRSLHVGWLAVAVLFLTLVALGSHAAAGEVRKFTLINVIFDGTKIWLPSSLIVRQGDTVELTLINKLDAPHGFEIADFGIEEVVQPKAKVTLRFTATKSGIHSYVCQIHPPHIGGQILVLSAAD